MWHYYVPLIASLETTLCAAFGEINVVRAQITRLHDQLAPWNDMSTSDDYTAINEIHASNFVNDTGDDSELRR